MDQRDRATLSQTFANFRKSYKEKLVKAGISRIKSHKNTINTITNDISFPGFLLDVEKVIATEIAPGKVQICIPLLSEPTAAIEIFKQNRFIVSSLPATFEFTCTGTDSKHAVATAKEFIDVFKTFSESITKEVAEFKAEYQKIIQDALDAEQQQLKDIKRNNDELTNLLRGK